MRLLLVFNPHAAYRRARHVLSRVHAALADFATVEVLESSGPGSAERQVADAAVESFDAVVAGGGDGTLFEVLNGLCRHDRGQRPPLGVLPVGTGNAFARDLGLTPGDWAGGVELLRSGRHRAVDVGRVEYAGPEGFHSYHFLNIVGAGLPVDAMRTAERLKFVGQSAYSLAALWQALRMRSHDLRIELDGDVLNEDALFIEVSNTRYTGTSFLMAPTAQFDDGLLDVTIVRRLPRHRLLRLFPTIYQGRHVAYPEVLTRQAREVRILAPSGLVLAPDGEFRGHTPATVACLHRELEIFA